MNNSHGQLFIQAGTELGQAQISYTLALQAWLTFVVVVKLFRLNYLSSFNKLEIINHVEEVDQTKTRSKKLNILL